ncbi:unnamed protein product [Orchesella dallaii]|uniref:Uncharacterized protein n=1 Tax=Orchesella dallaii TaxID=48710 RepID=A0ABP1RM56_9HEXA
MARNTDETWIEMRSIISHYFRNSTTEFLFDHKENEVSNGVFDSCIMVQCIILIFNLFISNQIVRNLTNDFEEQRIREILHEQLLGNATSLNALQRFSERDVLLVSGSTIHIENWENGFLQTSMTKGHLKNFIRLPTAIILPLSNTLRRILVLNQFAASILIFVRVENHSVSIGCFICEPGIDIDLHRKRAVSISFVTFPPEFATNFTSLISYWNRIHSNYYNDEKDEDASINCITISTYKLNPTVKESSCEFYEAYFLFINCSSFKGCMTFHETYLLLYLKTPKPFTDFVEVTYPYGLSLIDYTFQVLFPKVHFLDTHLTAFFTPLNLNVWLYAVACFAMVSLWLIWKEGQKLLIVLFWQYSVLLEQDGDDQLRKVGRPGIFLMIISIFSAILLRQFYNSSLYTFMTAQTKSNDYPKNLGELLNRKNFDFILPDSFLTTLDKIASEDAFNLPLKLEKIFVEILRKSKFVIDGNLERALENASLGIKSETFQMINEDKTVDRLATFLSNFDLKIESRKFSNFAILCKRSCDSEWNVVLFHQSRLEMIVPKQEPFIREVQIWSQSYPSFSTVRFSVFLGSFVHSGLYDLGVQRFQMLEQLMAIRRFKYVHNRNISNGSLFSYIFLADKNTEDENKEEPTKLVAFKGTFILTSSVLFISTCIFVAEVWNLSHFGK